MICKMTDEQIEDVLQIWLNASLIAHHFIPAAYWQSKVDDMRNIYLPSAENYVYLNDAAQVKGFISLCGDMIAALFVDPASQRLGIGSKLLEKAKSINCQLLLSVYEENNNAVNFYKKQGFVIQEKQMDDSTHCVEFVMKLVE